MASDRADRYTQDIGGAYHRNTHVFVLRVWSEPREIEGASPIYRGMVEHITSGQRRYVQDLFEVVEFISSHMADMPSSQGKSGMVRRWLGRLMR